MTEYKSADIDEVYEWISGIDGGYFKNKEDMLDYFDVFASIAGLLLWRATGSGHRHFQKRDDTKVTVTVMDTSGQRLNDLVDWCPIDYDWFEAKTYLSKTPTFSAMQFRDDVKEFIE